MILLVLSYYSLKFTTILPMGFQENLKEAMYIQGCTTKELSQKTGINAGTISSYLKTNAAVPPVDKAVRMAEALQVTVEFLVNGFNGSVLPFPVNPDLEELVKVLATFSHSDIQAVNVIVKALSEKYEGRD